jgi:Mg-chelatase subunit ChlD
LRILLITAIICALAGMNLQQPDRAGTVAAVADLSKSMPSGVRERHNESLKMLEQSRPRRNHLAIVSFAENAIIEKLPDDPSLKDVRSEPSGNASDLYGALSAAAALIPPDGSGRILLLTDGEWTGRDPAPLFNMLAARGIAVDWRLIRRKPGPDPAIREIIAPLTVAPREYFTATAVIYSPVKQTIEFKLRRNGEVVRSGRRVVQAGENRLFFRDKAENSGVINGRLSIKALNSKDMVSENNSAAYMVKAVGREPILLVTMSKNSSLGPLLRRGGFDVRIKLAEETRFTPGDLAGYRGIILENVPANLIGRTGMQNIVSLVRNTGIGLMMTGGKNSYGMGGYYHSPLEKIMPVSMELKKEMRKFAMSIVAVLDRSGSMGMQVKGGKTKMDLANQASAELLEIIGPQDEFGVIAVDSSPHIIIPLSKGNTLAGAGGKILSIDSMGGGIFVYTGLVEAVKMLMQSSCGTRHIILFADANDAEEPGKYKELLARCTKAGISVSVIALGTKKDRDSEFLIDVAKRGEGRVFFTQDPHELPRLFAQDTFTIARSSFINKPAKIKFPPELKTITGRNFGRTFEVGGYNISYLRPKSGMAAVSIDDYKAPAVAYRQAGTGKVMCLTFETDGEFTGKFATWTQAGDFLSALAGWTFGSGSNMLPGGMVLTQRIGNGLHQMKLHLDPERKKNSFRTLPQAISISRPNSQEDVTTNGKFRWLDPDTMVCDMPLNNPAAHLTAIKIPGKRIWRAAPVRLPYSPEFAPRRKDAVMELQRLCSRTGGRERSNLSGIWQELPVIVRLKPLTPYLLMAAIILLLLEVLERRTACNEKIMHLFTIIKQRSRRDKNPKNKSAKQSQTISANTSSTSKKEPSEKPVARRKKEKLKKPSEPDKNKDDDDNDGLVSALRKAGKRTNKK